MVSVGLYQNWSTNTATKKQHLYGVFLSKSSFFDTIYLKEKKMEPSKKKLLIIPAILFGVFIAIALILFLVLIRYQRAYRFIGLTICLAVISLLFLFASIVTSMVGFVRTNKHYFAFIEIIVISLTIVPVCLFSFTYSIAFSLGYSDYKLFQENYGTPQKYLKNGTGEYYCVYSKSYDSVGTEKIRDKDSKVFNLIYNAEYKKVEKMHQKSEYLNYAKYGEQKESYIKIFENGEAYIYDQGDLFYTGGIQYLVFDKEIANEIIDISNQIINEYLATTSSL